MTAVEAPRRRNSRTTGASLMASGRVPSTTATVIGQSPAGVLAWSWLRVGLVAGDRSDDEAALSCEYGTDVVGVAGRDRYGCVPVHDVAVLGVGDDDVVGAFGRIDPPRAVAS